MRVLPVYTFITTRRVNTYNFSDIWLLSKAQVQQRTARILTTKLRSRGEKKKPFDIFSTFSFSKHFSKQSQTTKAEAAKKEGRKKELHDHFLFRNSLLERRKPVCMRK